MSAKSTRSAKSVNALEQAVAKAGLSAVELDSVKAWLAEQFLGNMFAKLGQGGHVEGEIALRRVFVDLPVQWRGYSRMAVEGKKKEAPPRTLFLQHFMAATPIAPRLDAQAEHSFDAETIIAPEDCEIAKQMAIQGLLSNEGNLAVDEVAKQKTLAACLLVGGPGQGKSTLTQLACQLHRVALLNPFANDLSLRHQEALTSFNAPTLAKAKENGALLPPTQPCLPLQVSLPELAVWLLEQSAASETMPAILNFIATRLSAKRAQLAPETLLALANHLPILLVLDGFDEVGASDDRARLVHAAKALLAMLARCKARVQVLVTTRPQGYMGEMQHIGVPLLTCELELLEPDEALHYAQKLLAEKIPGVDEQETMLARLKTAANEAATQRLMTTPLQVTILAALVQHSGRAPRERWNLFHRYFTYTYNREVERNTYASSLLSEHRHHIELIHTRIALLLQVESESNGGAAARISAQRLAEIVHAVLQQDGVSKEERDALVDEITMAAQQRLVFLVEPEPGFFGFEIRSLQEFMAAWALTSDAREKDVEARLLAIAKSAIYRNVLLFAASRLFCEASPLRDVFADTICPALDNDSGDALARLTCAGSYLALEILEEGSVLAQPKRAKALFERACNLLNVPPGKELRRLVQLTNDDTAAILQAILETRLSQSGPLQDIAWVTVVRGIHAKKDWALELGERFCPNLAGSNIPINPRSIIDLESVLFGYCHDALNKGATTIALTIKFNYLRFIGNSGAGTKILAALSERSPNIPHATAIAKIDLSATQSRSFMEKLLTSDELSLNSKATAVHIARIWLGAEKTTIATAETWDSLKLPQPYPQQATIRTQSAYELPTAPIHFTTLDFKNIRILQKLDLPLQAPAASLGQWLVILGQNGVGKTTLLRSLALGLRDTQNLGIWPEGVFSKNWVTGSDESQPNQTNEAFITLTMANGAEHKTTIRQNGSTTVKQIVSPEPANRFPVFAYGCRRGSALSGGAREVNLDENGGPEIATLFNDDANLIHAETWLMKLIVAEQAEQEKPIFTAVVEALKTFLDLQHIEVRADGKAWITEHDGLVSTLENLSDGYLTSAGWFIDMIARWIELTRRNKKPIAADFMRHMNGLVLIDEIDLHLHPRWQIDIISRTRKLLPNMSFIVTTHNPLTLVGAKASEIRILVRENGRVVAKTGEETPMLLTGGQLYDRYFGIADIFPDGLGKDLHRFSFLAGFALRSEAEQAELETLQARLAQADIRPDWDIVPRRLPVQPATPAKPLAPAKPRSKKARAA
jgi:energy-coupling factor transporter ATP-binding protein EcfA2